MKLSEGAIRDRHDVSVRGLAREGGVLKPEGVYVCVCLVLLLFKLREGHVFAVKLRSDLRDVRMRLWTRRIRQSDLLILLFSLFIFSPALSQITITKPERGFRVQLGKPVEIEWTDNGVDVRVESVSVNIK